MKSACTVVALSTTAHKYACRCMIQLFDCSFPNRRLQNQSRSRGKCTITQANHLVVAVVKGNSCGSKDEERTKNEHPRTCATGSSRIAQRAWYNCSSHPGVSTADRGSIVLVLQCLARVGWWRSHAIPWERAMQSDGIEPQAVSPI